MWHSKSLVEVIAEHPGHDLSEIAILNDFELMEELRSMVTTEPTVGVMDAPTGIPPHISQAVKQVVTNLKLHT